MAVALRTEDFVVERWKRSMMDGDPAGARPASARKPPPGMLGAPPSTPNHTLAPHMATRAIFTYPNSPVIQNPTLHSNASGCGPERSFVGVQLPDRHHHTSFTSQASNASGMHLAKAVGQQQQQQLQPQQHAMHGHHALGCGGPAQQPWQQGQLPGYLHGDGSSMAFWQQQQRADPGGMHGQQQLVQATCVTPIVESVGSLPGRESGLWYKVKSVFTKKPKMPQSGHKMNAQGAAAAIADVEALWQQQQQQHHADMQQAWHTAQQKQAWEQQQQSQACQGHIQGDVQEGSGQYGGKQRQQRQLQQAGQQHSQWQQQQQQQQPQLLRHHQPSPALEPKQLQQQTIGPWYNHMQALIQQQYLLTSPIVVPAPVLMDVMAQVQRSNELLRKESQARTNGMRSLVHVVNRNLAVTEQLAVATGLRIPTSASRPTSAWQRNHEHHDLQLGLQQTQGQQQQPQHAARAWQEPVAATQLVTTPRLLPGGKWDQVRDLRLAAWHLPGLNYRGPGDQSAITVVAQVLRASGVDLVALQGLSNPAVPAKVCALLNLWDADGAGSWRSTCGLQVSTTYGSDAIPEHTAFIWHEPQVLSWSTSAAAEADAAAQHAAHQSAQGRPAPGWQSHGSAKDFFSVEAGVGGVAAGGHSEHAARGGIFVGLFSVGHRPVLVVPVPPSHANTSQHRTSQQVAAQLLLSIEAAAKRAQQQYPALAGQVWTALLGAFRLEFSSTTERTAWEPLLVGAEYGLYSEGAGMGSSLQGNAANIYISKVPASSTPGRQQLGSTAERVVLPVSEQGDAGEHAQAPYRSGRLTLKPALQALLPGSGPLVWGEVRVWPRKGLPPQIAGLRNQDQQLQGPGRNGWSERSQAVSGSHPGAHHGSHQYWESRSRGLDMGHTGQGGRQYGLDVDVEGSQGREGAARGTKGGAGYGLGSEIDSAPRTSQAAGVSLGVSKAPVSGGTRAPQDHSPPSRPASGFGLGEEVRAPLDRTALGAGTGGSVPNRGTGGYTGAARAGDGTANQRTGEEFGLGADAGIKTAGGLRGASTTSAGSGSGARGGGYGLGEEVRSPSPGSSAATGLAMGARLGTASGSGNGLAGNARSGTGTSGPANAAGSAGAKGFGLSSEAGSAAAVGGLRSSQGSSAMDRGGSGAGGGFGLGEEVRGGPGKANAGIAAKSNSPALKPSGGFGLGAEL